MKRVLIITYYFPPAGGSGVQRTLKFVKYLRQFGWEPVVYTSSNGEYPELDPSLTKEIPNDIEIHRLPIWEPYSLFKRFSGKSSKEKVNPNFFNQKHQDWKSKLSVWIRSNFFIPDARMFWIKPSVKYLKTYLSKHPVDAIISSGPPHSLHLIGLELHQQTHIPWLADFRDPWTNIDFYQNLTLTSWADAKHRALEYEVLSKASRVVTVGETWRQELEVIAKRPVDLISNGYDDEDVLTNQALALDTKFSIVHIGMMGGARNHEVFWKVLAKLVHTETSFADNLEIRLHGKVDASVPQYVQKYQLESYVKYVPYLPHQEVLKVQKTARVLYLSVNRAANAKGINTGKIYEYIASGRPILAIGPLNGDAALTMGSVGYHYISDFDDVESLEKNILALFHSYLDGKDLPVPVSPERYSRKELTRKLAEILNQISNY